MLDEETIDEAIGSIYESIEFIKYAIKKSDSDEVKKKLKQAVDNLKETMNEIKGNHNIKCPICGIILHKPEKEKLYLFNWDEIPRNDDEKLIKYLIENFNFSIDWVKTANIEKIDDDKTIRVFTEKNWLSLKLNDEKTKVNLTIDDGRSDECIAMIENSELNLYKTSIKCPICKMPVKVEQ